ncbi:MAG: hypothetical protein HPY82_02985 [Gammaproteobacteria bacterium]|nr:hypothetical protein [Gammaproteobacteria bacterium]
MEKKYAGMTVNERLCASVLMDEFYEAVEKKDTEKVRALLKKVELTEDSIKPILEKLEL